LSPDLKARLLWIVWLLVSASHLQAERFVGITSDITVTNTRPSAAGSNHRIWSFSVSCIVSTNRWSMVITGVADSRRELYYDGTNVYDSLIGTNQEPVTRTAQVGFFMTVNPTNTKNLPRATINIKSSPGGHPLADICANIPWLAYLSGSYLKLENRIVPLPISSDVSGVPDSFSYTDKTEVFADAFGLPKVLELYTSRSQYEKSLYDERLFRTKRVLDARLYPRFSLPDGVLRFRYSLIASTNFGGWSFPTEFTFQGFQVDSNGNAFLAGDGDGKTTAIYECGPPHNVFESGSIQRIIDNRFRHDTKVVDEIVYTWTNGEVPATDQPVLQAMFAQRLERAGVERRAWVPEIRTMLVFVALLIPAAFFVAIVFFRIRGQRKLSEKK
jgi:hypothetical protein